MAGNVLETGHGVKDLPREVDRPYSFSVVDSERSRSALAPPAGGKARRTFDTLVASTRQLVNETGGFTPEAAAQRAGVGTATFYSYFASRDEVLGAALDVVLRELAERVTGELGVEGLLDRGLESVIGGAVRTAIECFRADVLVYRLALARLPESAGIREVYRRRQAQAYSAIHRFVELAMAAGRITADDPDTVATALLVALQGLNNPLLLGPRRDPAVVEHLTGMMLGLLRPVPVTSTASI